MIGELANSIKKLFSKGIHKRYEEPLFRDSNLQNEMAVKGYAVRPLLNTSEVEYLKQELNRLIDLLPGGLPDTHWTSGRLDDPKLRQIAREAVDKIVPARLHEYFDESVADFIGGIFLAKKPSATSELYPHQDSSHVDEDVSFGVYAWIALTDTTVHNGAMHALPGSHLFGNKHRSLNVPWLYSGLEKVMFKYLVPCEMKAGEVLFFDAATIHYSSNNMSNEMRPAINFFVKPKQQMFLHHFIDDKTPAGKVEVFNVDIDFFYKEDFMQRPPARYKFLGYADRITHKPTQQEFEKMCINNRA
jgi:hypothetical protein